MTVILNYKLYSCLCFLLLLQICFLPLTFKLYLPLFIYFTARYVASYLRMSRTNMNIAVETYMVKPNIHQVLEEKLKGELCTIKLSFVSCSHIPLITTSSISLYHSSYNIFYVNCILYVYLPFTLVVKENVRKCLWAK